MRWPWVSRKAAKKKVDTYRRLYNDAAAQLVASEQVRKFAQDQLVIAQHDAADARLKLLRVGFGINPFHELVAAEMDKSSILPDQPSPEPAFNSIQPGMAPEEVMATFVKEAVDVEGLTNLRQIKHHVEKRQAEYYAGRLTPQIATPEELAAADRIAQDLEAAIEEGRAAFEGTF